MDLDRSGIRRAFLQALHNIRWYGYHTPSKTSHVEYSEVVLQKQNEEVSDFDLVVLHSRIGKVQDARMPEKHGLPPCHSLAGGSCDGVCVLRYHWFLSSTGLETLKAMGRLLLRMSLTSVVLRLRNIVSNGQSAEFIGDELEPVVKVLL